MAEDIAALITATVSASDALQQATATHRRELAAIRQGPLPRDQKPREIAASHLAAAQRVAAAKRDDTGALEAAARQAEMQAFAPRPAELARARRAEDTRTAYDRAAKVATPAAAHDLLDQAETESDHSLGRITALHAHRQAVKASTSAVARQWAGVVTRWADSQPRAVRAHLDDWAEATHLLRRAGKIGRDAAYRVTPPPEISGMSQAQVRNLAAGAVGKYGGP